MSLDGLRAWIGILERKLTMRTRVFLVLVAIAIGGAGAGIYLGATAQSDRVSEGDLQAVRDELEGRVNALEAEGSVAAGGAEDPRVAALSRQVKALQAQVTGLEGEAK